MIEVFDAIGEIAHSLPVVTQIFLMRCCPDRFRLMPMLRSWLGIWLLTLLVRLLCGVLVSPASSWHLSHQAPMPLLGVAALMSLVTVLVGTLLKVCLEEANPGNLIK